VKGTVNIDGKPMASGDVIFNIAGELPKGFTVTNGKFSGEAYEGKNRVDVISNKDGPPLSTDPNTPTKINVVSPKYAGERSILNAEVKTGGANDFKFDVTTN